MPRNKKAKPANKRALAFAVKNKFRAFPILHVNQVIRGNTVLITLDLGFTIFKKERVVLGGIQVPSLRTKSVEEKILAEAAKKELGRLLETEELECVVTGKTSTGCTLGIIFGSDSTSINEQLVNNGFAWAESDSKMDLEMLRVLQGTE